MRERRLRNDVDMPVLGIGVWQIPDDEVTAAVTHALRLGYRSVDTAMIYGNERGTGRAITGSDVPRAEVFLTTKLWNADQGRDTTLRAFDASIERLGVDYVDLYLIHWPVAFRGLYVETWRAIVSLLQEGRIRAAGVSNFLPEHLDRLVYETGVIPAVNQIEYHPRWQPRELQEANDRLGIVTEAWSPLGHGAALDLPEIVAIAREVGRSPAQVVVRWHLQQGRVVIPKADVPAHIAENIDVWDFELTAAQVAVIDGLSRDDGRVGPDPVTFVE